MTGGNPSIQSTFQETSIISKFLMYLTGTSLILHSSNGLSKILSHFKQIVYQSMSCLFISLINQAVHVLSKELGWFFLHKVVSLKSYRCPLINISFIYVHINFSTIYPDNKFKVTSSLFWVHPTRFTESLYENVSSQLVEFFWFSKRKQHCK